ncbi:Dabb family protein [Mycobacterium sp. OAE908]|uniref:Dabb family protein n=1 Tax=Mycobacterium sp. OAE908 TaxID=2817899 RepID=UPI001AE56FCE
MYNVTRLIHTSSDASRDQLLTPLRTFASVADHAIVAPSLPGSRNGGNILMHLRFANDDQWTSVASDLEEILSKPLVMHIDGAEYRGIPQSAERPARGSVYRTLLLRVAPDADETIIAQFEDDLRLLPRYVNTIIAWQLSRVDEPLGTSAWTHVFEQEFTDVDGLMGPYLMHPIHWAVVDRWFDPECPEVIVRDRVCHSFCRIGGAVS